MPIPVHPSEAENLDDHYRPFVFWIALLSNTSHPNQVPVSASLFQRLPHMSITYLD